MYKICTRKTNFVYVVLGYVHTVTFLHGFVLFHNPKGIPIYFQTIENDAKTLPCAHSLNVYFLTPTLQTCEPNCMDRSVERRNNQFEVSIIKEV